MPSGVYTRSIEYIESRMGRHNSVEHNKRISEFRTGTKFSEKVKHKMSITQTKLIINGKRKNFENCFFRQDLEHMCRSKFEANYCRTLKHLGVKYIYETNKNSFKLSNDTNYICDLYLPETNEYIELKGQLSKKDENKYKLFAEEFPSIKWRIIFQKSEEWNKMKKEYQHKIPNWEF